MNINEAKSLQPGERVVVRMNHGTCGGDVIACTARTFSVKWHDGIVSTIEHEYAERVQRETPIVPLVLTWVDRSAGFRQRWVLTNGHGTELGDVSSIGKGPGQLWDANASEFTGMYATQPAARDALEAYCRKVLTKFPGRAP